MPALSHEADLNASVRRPWRAGSIAIAAMRQRKRGADDGA